MGAETSKEEKEETDVVVTSSKSDNLKPQRKQSSNNLLSAGSNESLTGNATGSGRTKVALKPGHSLMDWIKLTASAPNLSGTNGQILIVDEKELAKHNIEEDCWLCLNGKVYNVSAYRNFHPGGVDQLMKGAGTDATELFNSTHRWVNYEGLLKKCFVGHYQSTVFD